MKYFKKTTKKSSEEDQKSKIPLPVTEIEEKEQLVLELKDIDGKSGK